MEQILIIGGVALLSMLVLGGVLGLAIGIVAKKFEVPVDPRVEEVNAMLPAANCGGCGYAGCMDFAKALVSGDTKQPEKCVAANAETVEKIATYLGLIAAGGVKKIALVLCGGKNSVATQGAHYNGVADCTSAMLVSSGVKSCPNGCLGYASCAHACPFNAIEIIDGLAVVHPELCVGCAKCVETCPRKLIKLVPQTAHVHVFCNSKIKGADKRKFCKVGCIGCRKCQKAAGEETISFEGALARVNYDHPPADDLVAKAGCPVHCIRFEHGYQPTEVAVEEGAQA